MINLYPLLKKYQKLPNNKKLSLFFLGYWVFLVLFVKADKKGVFGKDIGVIKTLKTSSLARIMFQDIGAMATAISIWIIHTGKSFWKWPVALLTIFIGSFAFLPYLAIILWKDKKDFLASKKKIRNIFWKILKT
jgi:hypothetical protein